MSSNTKTTYKYTLLKGQQSVKGLNVYNITKNSDKTDCFGYVVLNEGDVFSVSEPISEWSNYSYFSSLKNNPFVKEYIEPDIKTKKEVADKTQKTIEEVEEVEKKK